MEQFSTMVTRDILDEQFGQSILRVAPDPDDLGLVEMTVPETNFRATLPVHSIPQVIAALEACAKEISGVSE